MNPQIAELIRTVLKLAGMIAVAHGATKAAAFINAEDTIGAISTIAGIVWGLVSNSKNSILQKAADSLPPSTVLPATTDAAPAAKVMSPETATEFIRKPTPTTP